MKIQRYRKALAAALAAVVGIAGTLGYVDEATASALLEHGEALLAAGAMIVAAVVAVPNDA